jgi:hypothetical protein
MPHGWPAIVVHMRLGQDPSPTMGAPWCRRHRLSACRRRICAPSRASASSTLSTVMSRGTGMLHLTSNVSADRWPPGAVIVSSATGVKEQPGGVLIDLTSHRFDLEVFPPSEHTCTAVTRSEAQPLDCGTRHSAGRLVRVAESCRRIAAGNIKRRIVN